MARNEEDKPAVERRRRGPSRKAPGPIDGDAGRAGARRTLPPMITYAQNFEDVLLRRALWDIENGFYVDVGAFHPVVDSVTYWFYRQGWSGVNVEPNPRFHALLCEQRPHDINVAAAVAGRSGVLDLHLLDGLSTTVGDIAARHARAGHQSEGRLRVKALSLDDLFTRHVGTDRTIDFLKIDVEGAETDILAAYRFTDIRPRLLIIEATAPDRAELASNDWEKMLLVQGYRFCYFDGLNRYLVRDEDAWRQELFGAPPNVFDSFRLPFTDRRVDYVASAQAVFDQTPEGGVSALISERDRLRHDRDAWSERARAYEADRDAWSERARAYEADRDAWSERARAYEAERDALARERDAVRVALEACQRELASLSETDSRLQLSLHDLKAFLGAEQMTFARELGELGRELTSSLKAAEETLNRSEDDRQRLLVEEQDGLIRLRTLSENYERLRAASSEDRALISELRQMNECLKARVVETEARLRELESALDASVLRGARLQIKFDALRLN